MTLLLTPPVLPFKIVLSGDEEELGLEADDVAGVDDIVGVNDTGLPFVEIIFCALVPKAIELVTVL